MTDAIDPTYTRPQDDLHDLREKVRAIIRAEIAPFHPTDEARQPLELIVETFLRYGAVDGIPVITVMDANGQPRLIQDEGGLRAATIGDLLEELRTTRPALFSPIPQDPVADVPMPVDAAIVDMAPAVEPERDWLDLGPTDRFRSEEAPDGHRRGLPRQAARLRAWSRRMARDGRMIGTLTLAEFRSLRERAGHALHRVRGGTAGRMQRWRAAPPVSARPLALGAAAMAALIAIGLLAVSFRGEPVAMAESADPTETGSIATRNGPLHGVPDVLDTATLSLKGRVVHLFGVEWAAGGGKPEDLARYLNGRAVTCMPVPAAESYRCAVDGHDLSKVVLYNGAGRATAQATEDLKAAAERARKARIGVWSR